MKKKRVIFFAVLLIAIIGCSAVSMAATSYSGTHWYSSNTVYATGFVSITKGSWLISDDVVYGFGLYPKAPQYLNDCNASSLIYKVYAKNKTITIKSGTINGQSYYGNTGHGSSLKNACYKVTTDNGTTNSPTVSY